MTLLQFACLKHKSYNWRKLTGFGQVEKWPSMPASTLIYLVVTCFALLWQMFIVVNDFSLHSHLNPFALTLTLHSFYCWLLSLALTYYCIMLNLFYLFCFDYIIRWTMKTVISLISTYVWLLSRSKLFSKYIYYRTRVHKHIAFWLLNYLELSVFKSSTEPLSFWQWNRL